MSALGSGRREPDADPPLLPDLTTDEADLGWGDRPGSGDRDDEDPDDLERFLRDVPPHHGS